MILGVIAMRKGREPGRNDASTGKKRDSTAVAMVESAVNVLLTTLTRIMAVRKRRNERRRDMVKAIRADTGLGDLAGRAKRRPRQLTNILLSTLACIIY